MVETNNLDEIKMAIIDIGKLIHVRYKGWIKRTELTPQEIIDSAEFKNEFERPYPNLSKFILDSYKRAQNVKY